MTETESIEYKQSWRYSCRKPGIQPQIYDFQIANLMLNFHANPAHLQAAGLEMDRTTPITIPITTPITTPKSTQKSTQKILAIIRDKPTVSRREIAELLGDLSENSVKYLIERMKEDGIVQRIGPAKGGRWEIIGEENGERRRA